MIVKVVYSSDSGAWNSSLREFKGVFSRCLLKDVPEIGRHQIHRSFWFSRSKLIAATLSERDQHPLSR